MLLMSLEHYVDGQGACRGDDDANTLVGEKWGQILYEESFCARDSGTLEQLKELSSRRLAIQDSINGISRLTPVIAREMAGGITSPVLQVRQIVHNFPIFPFQALKTFSLF